MSNLSHKLSNRISSVTHETGNNERPRSRRAANAKQAVVASRYRKLEAWIWKREWDAKDFGRNENSKLNRRKNFAKRLN